MASVLHTAVWVDDLDETTAYYKDVLDLKDSRVSGDESERNVFLKDAGGTEVQFKYASNHEVAGGRNVVDHLAFEVDDIDATVADAIDAGSDVLVDPYTNDAGTAKGAYVTDPNGYAIELIEYLE